MDPIQWFLHDTTRTIDEAVREFPRQDVWTLRKARHEAVKQSVMDQGDPGRLAEFVGADLTPTARAIVRSGALQPVQYSFEDQYRPIKPTLAKGTDPTLVISDIHAGDDHDLRAVDLAIQVGQAAGVESVIFNGDSFDCHSLSRYTPGADRPLRWAEERQKALPVIARIVYAFRKQRKIWHHGNHCVRPLKWISANAPQLQGLFTLEHLLGIEDFGFEFPEDNVTILNGDTLVKHGVKVAQAAGASVMKEVIDHGMSVIMGHVHRLSFNPVTKTVQRVQNRPYWFGVEGGCLCNPRPEYLDREQTANWQQGFVVTSVHNGILIPEPVMVMGPHAFFRGHCFTSRVA